MVAEESEEDGSSTESSETSSEEDIADHERSSKVPQETAASSEDEAIQAFLLRHRRVDQREVTLKIKSDILNLWFDVLVGEGKFDQEARKEILARYWLSETQHDRMTPP